MDVHVVAVDDAPLTRLDFTRVLGLGASHRIAVLHHQKKLGEGNLAVIVHIHLLDQMLSCLDLNKDDEDRVKMNWTHITLALEPTRINKEKVKTF